MVIPECDHKSVGIIIYKEDKILMIERRNPPFGFAPPAGHVDGDATFEEAAIRETEEETGLKVVRLDLLTAGRKENPCRRPEGTWHGWKIYKAEATGEVKRSLSETKQALWCSQEDIKRLAARTDNYLRGQLPQKLWEEKPGLEPVWVEWFKELDIV